MKEFDICDMILDLKEREMLPCLMFHLNSFEAIRLLQALLAGLEYRQKVAHPTYYLDKIAEKSLLKKAADAAVKSTGERCRRRRAERWREERIGMRGADEEGKEERREKREE